MRNIKWLSRCMAIIMLLLLLTACGNKNQAVWQEKYDQGMEYLNQGDFGLAVASFTKAIELDPDRPEAYIGRGDAYRADGEHNFSLAQKDYEDALELDDTLADAWLGLCQLFVAQGDPQQALEILEEAAEKTDASEIRSRLEELQAEVSQQSEENQAPGAVDSAEYTIQRQDLSCRNGEGQVLINLYYDKVILTGDNFQTINDDINSDYLEAFPDEKTMEQYATFLADPYLSPDSPYQNTFEAQVTQNGDGIFSIRIFQRWNMGGSSTLNAYGLTYDLNTGKAATLADLTNLEESTLTQKLKTNIKDYIDANPSPYDWFSDAGETVDSIPLEQFQYYVKDGEIILCFESYLLAPGASGCIEIPAGISLALGESRPEQPEQGQPEPPKQPAGEAASQVAMDHHYGSQEYAVVQGLSADEEVLWTYETARYDSAQLQQISQIGTIGDMYCLVEGGTVVALDLKTGQVRWSNSDFGGASTAFTWDDNYIYLSGNMGPDLYVVDRTGKTVARSDKLNSDYMFPMEIALDGDKVVLTYEACMDSSDSAPYCLAVNPATMEASAR